MQLHCDLSLMAGNYKVTLQSGVAVQNVGSAGVFV